MSNQRRNGSQVPPNASFAKSLHVLGEENAIRIFNSALSPPTIQNETTNTPSLRAEATHAMQFLGDVKKGGHMRRVSISVMEREKDVTQSLVETARVADLEGIDLFSAMNFPIARHELYRMAVSVANPSGNKAPKTDEGVTKRDEVKEEKSKMQEVKIALLVFVREFFSTERIAKWLPEVVNTIQVSNAYMIQLIKTEFPNLVYALSAVVYVDRMRILQDSLSEGDLKTLSVDLPIRVENLKHEGFPILHKIVKHWLGDVSFELLEEGSRDGIINRRVAGIRFDHRLATWNGVALKKGEQLIWHQSEFSHDRELQSIRKLLTSSPISHQEVVQPVEFTVGSRYVIKAHLAFRLFGMLPVPPCTLWLDVEVTSYSSV